MKKSMSIFNLQQFSVDQSRSGMKLCSDSLLFGALIPIQSATRILDIGTGTGILALMQAQKINALKAESALPSAITAVEVTQAASEEAQLNFNNSPWPEQLKLVNQDIQSFADHHNLEQRLGFDLIICNPPFFAEQSKTSINNPLRNTARHTDLLSFDDLIMSIDKLLSANGKVFLLLPSIALSDVSSKANAKGFNLIRQIDIAESEGHSSKVAVLEFERSQGECKSQCIVQRLNKFQQSNVHSDEVKKLLQPFLLRYR
ncbi:MAG: ribose-phosphate pyrophosphokinase [Oleispira sp.]|nr:ribose-phosphate pyrophosphokinase [Oleispira sp.]|tara:strand:+ start:883 stop:1659 length:777 start_codon:yes stop_codon:yes gene_type:complete